MRIDDLVKRRFEELDKKAGDVAATRRQITLNVRRSAYWGEKEHGDRTADVIDMPGFRAWGTSVLSLLERAFGKDGAHYQEFSKRYSQANDVERHLHECKAIFDAAREDYLGGYLVDLAESIRADVFTDYLEATDHLNAEGYKDAAAVIAGSTLEQHLRALCVKHGISTADANSRPKKADGLNSELCSAGAYAKGDQKNVTAWLDLRNSAAHGHYTNYTKEQVALLIQSVRDFITRNPA